MNLSLKWLKDYVDINVSPKEYSDALTMSGSKVEGFENLGDSIINVVAGKIVKTEKHPDADKLTICQVDVGEEAPLQIVTGATNVAEGDIVPVCKDGAVLPGGKKIKSGKLRGVLSSGMLCSLSELGLTLNDYPYAIEDGIFIIEEDCRPGQDIREVLGLDDTVVEFEITSNRPDCLSVIGLARETAATFGLPLTLHTPVVHEDGGNIADYIKVEVKEPSLCTHYSARVIKNVKIAPSPSWLRERLRASGVRPINNIVDITNYVMLEYGQPMHAFDYECISGNKITVRKALDGEKMNTLDGVTRTLADSILVIADDTKPVALAGIMGGENSEIKASTTTVVFESATFNGACVRLGAKKVGLRTESSGRFEKGLDPFNAIPALERACELVNQLCAGEVVSGRIDIDNASPEKRSFPLELDWINSFLGIAVSKETAVDYLKRLEIEVDSKDNVIIPTFRNDLEQKADVAEEIARLYGYDKIPSTMFKGTVLQGKLTKEQQFEKNILQAMTALGLNEITTYSFISPKYYEKIGCGKNNHACNSVVISNPLGEDTSVMRTVMMPSMLETLSRNFNLRNSEASLFELGTTYVPNEDENLLPIEKSTLVIGLYGAKTDFYDLKGIIEELFSSIGVLHTEYELNSDLPYFHPGRTAKITSKGNVLGFFGQIHPKIVAGYDMDCEVFCAEIDVDALLKTELKVSEYKSLPKYPAVTRDLALLCDDSIPVAALQKAIKSGGGNILETIKLFDVYKGKQIEEGKKSVAFSLSFRDKEKTLSDSDIDTSMKKIFRELEKTGAKLRT